MPEDPTGSAGRPFDAGDTAVLLGDFSKEYRIEPSEDGRGLLILGTGGRPLWRVTPPLLQPLPSGGWDLARYIESLEAPTGKVFVLLLQAGACAMGFWRDAVLAHHKVIKKYVVRGQGRAQPAYLKTRGKSRYGSRLRLRNAENLLSEASAKMAEWWEEEGPAERVFASCPVRLWPELFAGDPPPPFPQRGFHTRIPLAVRVPSFAELQRVWWHLSHGRMAEIDQGGKEGAG
jgi:hypothetical protein